MHILPFGDGPATDVSLTAVWFFADSPVVVAAANFLPFDRVANRFELVCWWSTKTRQGLWWNDRGVSILNLGGKYNEPVPSRQR
jgi:hypothetical protein